MTPTFPAAYTNRNIMTVIATDQNDGLAGYSNYGARNTDIAAPGSKILSTVLNGQVAGLGTTSPPDCNACMRWGCRLLLHMLEVNAEDEAAAPLPRQLGNEHRMHRVEPKHLFNILTNALCSCSTRYMRAPRSQLASWRVPQRCCWPRTGMRA